MESVRRLCNGCAHAPRRTGRLVRWNSGQECFMKWIYSSESVVERRRTPEIPRACSARFCRVRGSDAPSLGCHSLFYHELAGVAASQFRSSIGTISLAIQAAASLRVAFGAAPGMLLPLREGQRSALSIGSGHNPR